MYDAEEVVQIRGREKTATRTRGINPQWIMVLLLLLGQLLLGAYYCGQFSERVSGLEQQVGELKAAVHELSAHMLAR